MIIKGLCSSCSSGGSRICQERADRGKHGAWAYNGGLGVVPPAE